MSTESLAPSATSLIQDSADDPTHVKDTEYRLARLFDSVAFWAPWLAKKLLLSQWATLLYFVVVFCANLYFNLPRFEGMANVDGVKNNTALRTTVPWLLTGVFSLILMLPWLLSKRKEAKDMSVHQVLVAEHLIPFLDKVMYSLAEEISNTSLGEVIDPEDFETIGMGNVRAHITIVRKHWFRRYLDHLASSDSVTRTDREVSFRLDEGLPGFAYSRPGNIFIEPYEVAVKRLQPKTRDKISKSNRVVACRAIGLDIRSVKRPWFNRVLGVLIITSDDPDDLERFKDPIFGEIVHKTASGLVKLLADIRRAYDGY